MDIFDVASETSSDDRISTPNGDVRLSLFNMICADGEYEGEWNQFGQREGRGIMTYLDSSSRG